MSSVLDGFLGEAAGAVVGAGVGFASGHGRWFERAAPALLGAAAGQALVSGVSGLSASIDTEGLTPAEIEQLQQEAERLERWRNLTRIMAAGGGVTSAMVLRSPVPLIAALPAATIGPLGPDARRLNRLAKHFRDARRTG